MELIKELKSTYLSQPHYSYPSVSSLLYFSVCVLLSVLFWHHPEGEFLLAKGELVFGKGEYYRLITSQFIHGDLRHLLSNSFMLFILSYFVSQYYGKARFLTYSISAGIIINALTLLTMKPEIGLLGASGVVYFLWGFWLTLYVFIEKTVPLSRRIMKIVAISVFLLIPSSLDPQVSYMAHAVGFVVGLAYAFVHYIVTNKHIKTYERYIYHWDDYEDYVVMQTNFANENEYTAHNFH